MPIYTLDVRWALAALATDSDVYNRSSDYYEGRHRLAFATEKFRNQFGMLFKELAINHCAICVDVPSDRLQMQEPPFKPLSGGGGAVPLIAEIWRRNRMKKRAGEVHSEALKTGNSYVIVDWVNPEDPSTDRATIYPNQAGRCAVKYDDENPGYIVQATRWWVIPDNGKWRVRLNIYYKDRIEKYISKPRSDRLLPSRDNEFVPIADDPIVPNKYGKVPVFHFANNAAIGENGVGEIWPVIPPQDGLNKAVCDAMVGEEYSVMGQRWIVGMEPDVDDNGNPKAPFKDGLAHIWLVPPQRDQEGKTLSADQAQPIELGQFTPANLDQLLNIKTAFRQDISTISGIPSHYFMDAKGGWPSGEALKTAEQRLTSKVLDRQIAFGMVWEDVMRFCLEIEGQKDVVLETQWKDAAPALPSPIALQGTNT